MKQCSMARGSKKHERASSQLMAENNQNGLRPAYIHQKKKKKFRQVISQISRYI